MIEKVLLVFPQLKYFINSFLRSKLLISFYLILIFFSFFQDIFKPFLSRAVWFKFRLKLQTLKRWMTLFPIFFYSFRFTCLSIFMFSLYFIFLSSFKFYFLNYNQSNIVAQFLLFPFHFSFSSFPFFSLSIRLSVS